MATPSTLRTNRTALTIVFLLGLWGCGHPVQRKLEGRWLGDTVENFDTAEVAAVTGWVRGLSLEFSGSNVTIAVAAEEPRSGKYRVSSVHQNDVSLAIRRPDGKTDKAAFKLDDERSIRWMIGDSRAVVLRRER